MGTIQCGTCRDYVDCSEDQVDLLNEDKPIKQQSTWTTTTWSGHLTTIGVEKCSP